MLFYSIPHQHPTLRFFAHATRSNQQLQRVFQALALNSSERIRRFHQPHNSFYHSTLWLSACSRLTCFTITTKDSFLKRCLSATLQRLLWCTRTRLQISSATPSDRFLLRAAKAENVASTITSRQFWNMHRVCNETVSNLQPVLPPRSCSFFMRSHNDSTIADTNNIAFSRNCACLLILMVPSSVMARPL